jgi:putative transposase
MRLIGLKAIRPLKKTSIRDQSHKVYPYLLRDLIIDYPNQAWATDITYIKIKLGFIYLVCIIDVFSRKIMGWAVSISPDTKSCLEAYENATKQVKAEILNSDQGCQFTSEAWIDRLTLDGVKISMDGKKRWADNIIIERFWRNIKYESVFLNCFEDVKDAKEHIAIYINFYNSERPHQSLKYKTPDEVYFQFNKTKHDPKSAMTVSYSTTSFAESAIQDHVQIMEANMVI